jgi:Uma2 family endonuclease
MRQPILPEFDEPTFLQWEAAQRERYELHYGFVYAFAGGTMNHDQLAFSARVILQRAFPEPCRVVGSDIKVHIATKTYYYPDVSVTCEPFDGEQTIIERPRIVVEVLSRSTHGYDLVDKRNAYRSITSLEAYLIVHTDARRVELDRRDTDGRWRTDIVDEGEVLIGTGRFSIDELYAKTSIE